MGTRQSGPARGQHEKKALKSKRILHRAVRRYEVLKTQSEPPHSIFITP